MTFSVSKPSRSRNLSVALAVVGLVISVEYFFRHYVLFWLPVLGTLAVNDMLSSFLGIFTLADRPGQVCARPLAAGISRYWAVFT